jgi:hypothetical protein
MRTIKPPKIQEIVSPKVVVKGADKPKYPQTKNSKYPSRERPIIYPKNVDLFNLLSKVPPPYWLFVYFTKILKLKKNTI